MYEARRPCCAHGLHGGNYFLLLPRSALDGRVVLHFNSSAVETDVILRGNFSNIFQHNLQQIFLRYAFGNSLPKLSPENLLQKNPRNFPKIFRSHHQFYLGHRRPTNLGAAGEASSAAGETPAPTTLGLPTRLGYIGDAPRVALPHLP